MKILQYFALAAFVFCFVFEGLSQEPTSSLIGNEYSTTKPLSYKSGHRGNKVLDFSLAGYKGGGVKLPEFSSVLKNNQIIELSPSGDTSGKKDAAAIKKAVADITSWPLNQNGFKGGILLKEGVFYISSQIDIKTSGIIIAGAGSDINKNKRTIIIDKTNSYAFFVNKGAVDLNNSFNECKQLKSRY